MPDLNNSNDDKTFPVVPIRDVFVFPYMIAPILVSREKSVKAVENSINLNENTLILVAQKPPVTDDPEVEDLYEYGVLTKIIQVLKFPDGTLKAIVEGVSRVAVNKFEESDSVYFANISEIEEIVHSDIDTKALVKLTIDRFESYIRKNTRMSPDNLMLLSSLNNDPGRLADIIATYIEVEITEKQQILETFDTTKRLELTGQILERELEILDIEENISKKLKNTLNKTQKEFVLREKLKIIKEELYGKEDLDSEMEIYKQQINALPLSEKYKNKLRKELQRFQQTPQYSAESSVIKTYIDRILELPWNTTTKDKNDIKHARKILDEDHWGLQDVKERIVEYLAVKQLSNNKQGTIICFAGPPGVGKTSLAKSIARALNRKFSYISLGGVNDESEIRGHRRTYVGSMPGRIIQAIENAGSKNPVILLDEIEKMMRSHMGDPTAAMLEVLDPEQNINFTDHYIDIPFDLSEVFFIATANTLDSIYKALRDRLEVITLSGYTEEEKINIAKHFLIPKQQKKHGITKSRLSINDKAISRIINEYTKESGVRNLERSIAKICRKTATRLVNKQGSKFNVTELNIQKYLSAPRFALDDIRKENEVGVINGLAWTEFGGDVLLVESITMPGKGKLNLTGSLGDVMKESAKAALSFIRSNHKKYNLPPDLQRKYDFHIHFPDGATPKDGPSAGLAVVLALISALTGKPARADIAITGEITLRGKVLPVGGIKEKVLAALRNGIQRILIPEKNKKDIVELPDYIKEKVDIVYISTVDQAIKESFVDI